MMMATNNNFSNEKIMKRIRRYILLGIAVLSLFSCTSGFDSANQNPNAISTGKNLHAYNFFEPILYRVGCKWLNYTWYWNDELIQFTNSKLATGNAVSVTLSPTRYDPAPVTTPPVAGVAKVVT